MTVPPSNGVGFIDRGAWGALRREVGVIVISRPEGALVMLIQPAPFVILREVLSTVVPRTVADAMRIVKTGPALPTREEKSACPQT